MISMLIRSGNPDGAWSGGGVNSVEFMVVLFRPRFYKYDILVEARSNTCIFGAETDVDRPRRLITLRNTGVQLPGSDAFEKLESETLGYIELVGSTDGPPPIRACFGRGIVGNSVISLSLSGATMMNPEVLVTVRDVSAPIFYKTLPHSGGRIIGYLAGAVASSAWSEMGFTTRGLCPGTKVCLVATSYTLMAAVHPRFPYGTYLTVFIEVPTGGDADNVSGVSCPYEASPGHSLIPMRMWTPSASALTNILWPLKASTTEFFMSRTGYDKNAGVIRGRLAGPQQPDGSFADTSFRAALVMLIVAWTP